jgi:hypothetical protein
MGESSGLKIVLLTGLCASMISKKTWGHSMHGTTKTGRSSQGTHVLGLTAVAPTASVYIEPLRTATTTRHNSRRAACHHSPASSSTLQLCMYHLWPLACHQAVLGCLSAYMQRADQTKAACWQHTTCQHMTTAQESKQPGCTVMTVKLCRERPQSSKRSVLLAMPTTQYMCTHAA